MFSDGFDLRRHWAYLLLGALLTVHTAWAAYHLYLVSEDQVNPWKVGGYGMYTTVPPTARASLKVRSPNGFMVRIQNRAFTENNLMFSFKCRPVTKRSVLALIETDPAIVGRELSFDLTELQLKREPIRHVRRLYSTGSVFYQPDGSALLRQKLCGEIHETVLTREEIATAAAAQSS